MSQHKPVKSHMRRKSASSPDALVNAGRKSGIALSEQELKGVSGGLKIGDARESVDDKHKDEFSV